MPTTFEHRSRDLGVARNISHFPDSEVVKKSQANRELGRNIEQSRETDMVEILDHIEEFESREEAVRQMERDVDDRMAQVDCMKREVEEEKKDTRAEALRRNEEIEEHDAKAEKNMTARMRSVAELARETELKSQMLDKENEKKIRTPSIDSRIPF